MLDNYKKLENGIIMQEKIFKKFKYDFDYVNNRYNLISEKVSQMSYLRLGYISAGINRIPSSILDIGYGNGNFLNACSKIIDNCYGYDVSDYILPENITTLTNIYDNSFDVITMFDALEHIEDITFVKKLKCNFIVISVPWCHNLNDKWFEQWKHRRPDEHLWHFDDKSLVNFFDEMGYKLITQSNIEDVIRIPEDNLSNILTCIFKKKLKNE